MCTNMKLPLRNSYFNVTLGNYISFTYSAFNSQTEQ